MSAAVTWIWFGAAWLFIAAVALKHWRAIERRRAEETEKVLKSCGFDTTGNHYEDAL